MEDKSVNIFFIRHAQSVFNLEQDIAREQNNNIDPRCQENLEIKFTDRIIDAELTQKGQEQCKKAEDELKDVQIDLVIVSPLLRTLQTAELIFGNHKSKPQFIVNPLVSEMVFSNGDLSLIQNAKKLYPNHDFSSFDQFEHLHIWQLDNLINQDLAQKIKQKVLATYDKKPLDEKAVLIILEWMRSNYPAFLESFSDLNDRCRLAQQMLKQKLQGFQGKNVAVVTHSRFLYHFFGTELDENNEPLNVKWFENCEIRQHSLSLV